MGLHYGCQSVSSSFRAHRQGAMKPRQSVTTSVFILFTSLLGIKSTQSSKSLVVSVVVRFVTWTIRLYSSVKQWENSIWTPSCFNCLWIPHYWLPRPLVFERNGILTSGDRCPPSDLSYARSLSWPLYPHIPVLGDNFISLATTDVRTNALLLHLHCLSLLSWTLISSSIQVSVSKLCAP